MYLYFNNSEQVLQNDKHAEQKGQNIVETGEVFTVFLTHTTTYLFLQRKRQPVKT